MATAAELTQQIAQLEAVAATGQLRVEVTGPAGTKILIFQHLKEMRDYLRDLKWELAALNSVGTSQQGKFRSRQGVFPGG